MKATLRKVLPGLLRYVFILIIIIIAGLTLEYAAGLLPQEPIMRHYRESAEQLEEEGMQPMILNRYRADSMLNNTSETCILHYSAAMDTRTFPEAVLTNPCVLPQEKGSAMNYYEAAATGAEHNNHYRVLGGAFFAWLCAPLIGQYSIGGASRPG